MALVQIPVLVSAFDCAATLAVDPSVLVGPTSGLNRLITTYVLHKSPCPGEPAVSVPCAWVTESYCVLVGSGLSSGPDLESLKAG